MRDERLDVFRGLIMMYIVGVIHNLLLKILLAILNVVAILFNIVFIKLFGKMETFKFKYKIKEVS